MTLDSKLVFDSPLWSCMVTGRADRTERINTSPAHHLIHAMNTSTSGVEGRQVGAAADRRVAVHEAHACGVVGIIIEDIATTLQVSNIRPFVHSQHIRYSRRGSSSSNTDFGSQVRLQ